MKTYSVKSQWIPRFEWIDGCCDSSQSLRSRWMINTLRMGMRIGRWRIWASALQGLYP